MKVGSADPEEDVMRARAIREEIGPDNVLMMDANQKWDVNVRVHFPCRRVTPTSLPTYLISLLGSLCLGRRQSRT